MFKKFGFYDNPIDLIESYLTDREQQVSYRGFKSAAVKSYFGVPQGSVSEPLLFNLFINDMLFKLKTQSNTI